VGIVALPGLKARANPDGSLLVARCRFARKDRDMAAPRVFLSHSSRDAAFTARIEADLRAAGAVVYRVSADQGGDFQQRIDEALAACEWVVLVLTGDAVASPWVQQEIRAAIRLKNLGRIRDLLPIQAGPLDPRTLPPLWGVFNVFDATRDYAAARMDVLRALGLSTAVAPALLSSVSPPASTLPGEPASYLVPKTLYDLGFQGRIINGVEVVIPPTCAVPAGPFTMGSDKSRDPQAQDNEMPQYVIETEAFHIGKFPVTVAEYACAVRAGAIRAPQKSAYNALEWAAQVDKPTHPLVGASWQDTLTYVGWLERVTGMPWRLPTEAEWEKAARGTDGRIYPWGDTPEMARRDVAASVIHTITPVGRHPNSASPYGVQDMAWKVWEWTSSLFMPYPYRGGDGRENAAVMDSSNNRVLRGGSRFILYERPMRVAHRGSFHDIFGVYVGFRLVCAAAD
jgi:formylglycine-generating enzyme required for sulfatase activity